MQPGKRLKSFSRNGLISWIDKKFAFYDWRRGKLPLYKEGKKAHPMWWWGEILTRMPFTGWSYHPISAHQLIPSASEQGVYVCTMIAAHNWYFGAAINGSSISPRYKETCRMWVKAVRRRSYKHNLRWDRMVCLIVKWIPLPRICNPYPLERFGVVTCGRSPVR